MYAPVSPSIQDDHHTSTINLQLRDGAVFQGYSFGAPASVAGELVFQTGMVGYPESLTDPSYRGQILVITFPLVGNYGVPDWSVRDDLLGDLPSYFESSEIHVAGLVTASYSGEEFSHFLAHSSLGKWLKDKGVPAMYGVDTRMLTKQIREKGSMLGRMLFPRQEQNNGKYKHQPNGYYTDDAIDSWQDRFQMVDWKDPNLQNLVADGKP